MPNQVNLTLDDDGSGEDFNRERSANHLFTSSDGTIEIVTKENENGKKVAMLIFPIELPNGNIRKARTVIRANRLVGILAALDQWNTQGND